MQKKTPIIANTEINVSINRQFSAFILYSFTRNNRQITYSLVAQNKKKHVDKIKNVKNAFYGKILPTKSKSDQ